MFRTLFAQQSAQVLTRTQVVDKQNHVLFLRISNYTFHPKIIFHQYCFLLLCIFYGSNSPISERTCIFDHNANDDDEDEDVPSAIRPMQAVQPFPTDSSDFSTGGSPYHPIWSNNTMHNCWYSENNLLRAFRPVCTANERKWDEPNWTTTTKTKTHELNCNPTWHQLNWISLNNFVFELS